MLTILIMIVLALVLSGIALALLLPGPALPPVPSRFNFSERPPNSLFTNEVSPTPGDPSVERQTLLDRAAEGDQETLVEARAMRDAALYDAVLDALIDRTSSSQRDFDSLVRHIRENADLPANAKLAERVIEQYKTSPDRGRTAETVHLAARSDVPAVFEKAVETVLRLWYEDRIPELSAEELRELFESEYWVLGSEARQAGPGFALRQRLAEVRRQLATASRPAPIQQKHESLPDAMKENKS